MTLSTRLMPVAVGVAVLATLVALGASGLSVYRLWGFEQGDTLRDPFYFSEGLKRFGVVAVLAAILFAAVYVCLKILLNGFSRAAALLLLGGIIAGAVVQLATVWPSVMLDQMPKRYVDYTAIDFQTPARVGEIAGQFALVLLLTGWALFILAAFRRKTPPTPLRSKP